MELSDIKTDAQILRKGIEEELNAISLYEELASKAKSPHVKKILLDVAKEEKVHVGEFEILLEEIDPEYNSSNEKGGKEVTDLLSKNTINESVILTAIQTVIRDQHE